MVKEKKTNSKQPLSARGAVAARLHGSFMSNIISTFVYLNCNNCFQKNYRGIEANMVSCCVPELVYYCLLIKIIDKSCVYSLQAIGTIQNNGVKHSR